MGKSSGQGGGAARSAQREDTAPQDVQHFPVAVGDRRSPDGQARSAWPNKGRGRLACPNPPCVSIAAPRAGISLSWKGRRWSVPQLPQAASGCPQADARSLWSRLQPAPVPRLHSRGRSRRATGQPGAPCVSGPAREGRDGRGRAPRTGVRGDGSGRDIQPCSAAGRIAPTSSGGGRCSRPEPGARPEGDARISQRNSAEICISMPRPAISKIAVQKPPPDLSLSVSGFLSRIGLTPPQCGQAQL